MTEEVKLFAFEKKLKYMFLNIKYLKVALTHKSYAYERKKTGKNKYNERLEYLGDAILEHIISDLLFCSKPILSEGEMTKKRAEIVCEKTLSCAMKKIEAEKYIYVGKCERSNNNNIKDAILADAFEAVIGAIYLDNGYEASKVVCLELLDEYIQEVLNGKSLNEDYKTRLQEKLQAHGNVKIEYVITNEMGPDHNKMFYVDVLYNDKKIGEGSGKNKKAAEQDAARVALKKNI